MAWCLVKHRDNFTFIFPQSDNCQTPSHIRTLKMEAARSSETLVSHHITTGCHNPEDRDFIAVTVLPNTFIFFTGPLITVMKSRSLCRFISITVLQGATQILLWAITILNFSILYSPVLWPWTFHYSVTFVLSWTELSWSRFLGVFLLPVIFNVL
jgi:hypothetical protein